MKRDMDLVRKIMLELEGNPSTKPVQNLKIDGYDSETVAQHCEMLYQKGFLKNFKVQSADNIPYYFFWAGNLTMDGYDYLEKIRDESIWGKIKALARENGLELTFEVIKGIIDKVM